MIILGTLNATHHTDLVEQLSECSFTNLLAHAHRPRKYFKSERAPPIFFPSFAALKKEMATKIFTVSFERVCHLGYL